MRIIFQRYLHFGLLTDARWVLDFSCEVVDDLLAVRDGDTIKAQLWYFGDVIFNAVEVVLHEEPKGSDWVLLVA